jgi:hypothetical protein
MTQFGKRIRTDILHADCHERKHYIQVWHIRSLSQKQSVTQINSTKEGVIPEILTEEQSPLLSKGVTR